MVSKSGEKGKITYSRVNKDGSFTPIHEFSSEEMEVLTTEIQSGYICGKKISELPPVPVGDGGEVN